MAVPDHDSVVFRFFSAAVTEGFFATRLGVADDGTSGNTFGVGLGDSGLSNSSLSLGTVYMWVRSQQATYTQILTLCSEGIGGAREGAQGISTYQTTWYQDSKSTQYKISYWGITHSSPHGLRAHRRGNGFLALDIQGPCWFAVDYRPLPFLRGW